MVLRPDMIIIILPRHARIIFLIFLPPLRAHDGCHVMLRRDREATGSDTDLGVMSKAARSRDVMFVAI